MADDNLDKNKNNNVTNNTDTTTDLESTPNVALILQLLTNPKVLQQAVTVIATQNQLTPSVSIPTPNFTTSTPSNTLIGIINTSVNT